MSSRPLSPEVKAKIVRLYTDDQLTVGLIHERLGRSHESIIKALAEAGITVERGRRRRTFYDPS